MHAFATEAQDMFRIAFRVSCRSLNGNNTIRTTRITDRDIIARALGSNTVSNASLTRNFALIYNASSDSIQVVDTNGVVITDVIQFQDGTSISDGRQSERFTFMFVPDQTNAVGTAVVSERTPRNGTNATTASIRGQVQFVLTDDIVLGGASNAAANSANLGSSNGGKGINSGTSSSTEGTSSLASTSAVTGNTGSSLGTGNQGFFFSTAISAATNTATNVRICTGTFTATRRFNSSVNNAAFNTANGSATGTSASGTASSSATTGTTGTTGTTSTTGTSGS